MLFITLKNKNKLMSMYENIYITLLNFQHFCMEQYKNKLAIKKLGQGNKLK